jgi:hypothetical protein
MPNDCTASWLRRRLDGAVIATEVALSAASWFCLSDYPGFAGSFNHRENKFDLVARHVTIHGTMAG